MEALMEQFSSLSDQALGDRSFDPSKIEDLMRLFEVEAHESWAATEVEAHESWAATELEARVEEIKAEVALHSAMEEFRRFNA
ncbi:hypothetical protein SAY86_001282 [Trapa natans]|uniref:Uncharacterized protein n=1 Tax=Trapa natans TaxID=22666 RepID=A0AAN7MCC6_TRANT|nr:hypothetical protein SAY86_001282 [Trapa natans]